MDLFRCESSLLKSHWVLVVMDQFTRRIIGFGACAGDVDGITLCQLFNTAISTKGVPYYLSSDNDPLCRYYQWQASLRIMEIVEIKSIPHTLTSHPFVERLLERFGVNTRITSFFGMHTTLSENLRPFDNTTTRIGFINC